MKKLLAVASVGEATTGLLLVVYPPIAIRLLFGVEIAGEGVIMSHIAGISLTALGLACWPGSYSGGGTFQTLAGMLCYSLLATLYLAYLGIEGEYVGRLLWPAVALHAVLTILLARAWLQGQMTSGSKDRQATEQENDR